MCSPRFRSARVILFRFKCLSSFVPPCANFYFLCFKNVNALKDKIERLESILTRTSVSSALDTVRQLASRPTPLVDPYALIAALKQLADVSRETVYPDRKRYDAIFKQCIPLVVEPLLAAIVINLLGDEEEKLVAGQIHKLLKSNNLSPSPRGPVLQFGQGPQPGPRFLGPMFSTGFRGRTGGRSGPLRGKCFCCKRVGHFVANCPLNKKKQ